MQPSIIQFWGPVQGAPGAPPSAYILSRRKTLAHIIKCINYFGGFLVVFFWGWGGRF